MVLWRRSLDRYISVLPSSTSSFLPIMFNHPCGPTTVHVALYLPTSGREYQFVEEISKLRIFLENHLEAHPDHLIYIRGDSNVNSNHTDRMRIFKDFMNTILLKSTPIGHKTYHHFLGNGAFDSNIDVILYSQNCFLPEVIRSILCRSDHPGITSHHDLILSSFTLPLNLAEHLPNCEPVPQMENNRVKIIWHDEAIAEYRKLISSNLSNLRKRWLNPSSRSSISLLLQLTSEILSSAAVSSNKSIALSQPRVKRSTKVPLNVRISQRRLKEKNRRCKRLTTNNIPSIDSNNLIRKLKDSKVHHRRLIREHDAKDNILRDQELFSLMSANSSSIFRKIRASKTSSSEQIQILKVGNKDYHGENVKNGFFNSISELKSRKQFEDKRRWVENDTMEDFQNILDICQTKTDLPNISLAESTKILHKLKSTVNDIYSITSLHYINAGEEGVDHFHFLLNGVIEDVNNASIEELNSVYALLLHKGHNKPRNISNAYRTISTCPLLAKALDIYIRDLHLDKWNKEQAETQYQGEGSSHELAALLVTEIIQHSLYTLKEPIYLLFLDAKSAYDTVAP